jgi:ribonuclease HI
VKGLTVWMKNWKKNGWKASTGGTVKNDDLWRALDEAKDALSAAGVRLQLEWIKGHAGHTGNEAADRLAVNGIASP